MLHFEYRYRDGANYKAVGRVKLAGTLTKSERAEIVSRLENGELFVAEQVGVPTLYGNLHAFSDGPTSSDHSWHEYIAFRECETQEHDKEVWGAAAQLLSRFRSVVRWELQRSEHFALWFDLPVWVHRSYR